MNIFYIYFEEYLMYILESFCLLKTLLISLLHSGTLSYWSSLWM